jgi:hypothetical protein
MLVSIGIMLVIISIVIFNQSKYTTGAAIQNAANDISLALRQAQVYGVSVKEFTPGSNDFSPAYGMSFNILSSGGNNAYIFFADRGVQNGRYDGVWACALGGASECLDKTTMGQGNIISGLCQILPPNVEVCNLGRVDITFLRPSTDARFAFFHSTGGQISLPNAKGVRIKLTSPSTGLIRSVVIYRTGQISVQ